MPLAPLLVVTDRHQAEAAGRSLVQTVDAAIDAGARAVLLREKDLPRQQREPLAATIAARLLDAGGELVVASDPSLARSVGAIAVHLAAGDPWPADPGVLWIGRSCHSRDDVAEAARWGTTYVTLSPVFPTDSKPGYGPVLGPDGLGGGCEVPGAPPVFALGGITPGVVPVCMDAGAWGVAVMGAVMAAPDPSRAVDALLQAMP